MLKVAIVGLVLLGVLMAPVRVDAQDDFTFTIPVNMEKVASHIYQVAIVVHLFEGPPSKSSSDYPGDPNAAGPYDITRHVTILQNPLTGEIRQTINAALNVANPELISSWSVTTHIKRDNWWVCGLGNRTCVENGFGDTFRSGSF